MATFRDLFHNFGNTLNRINARNSQIGDIAKEIKSGESDIEYLEKIIKYSADSQEIVREAVTQITEIKNYMYRLANPDVNLSEIWEKIKSENTRILIYMVEDDIEMCEIYKERFQKKGYRFEYSITADDAILKIDEKMPNIVLLDLQMAGGKNGIDVLRAIKEIKGGIQTIIITNEDKDVVIDEVRKLGAEEVLNKPIDMGQLDARLSKLIGRIRW